MSTFSLSSASSASPSSGMDLSKAEVVSTTTQVKTTTASGVLLSSKTTSSAPLEEPVFKKVKRSESDTEKNLFWSYKDLADIDLEKHYPCPIEEQIQIERYKASTFISKKRCRSIRDIWERFTYWVTLPIVKCRKKKGDPDPVKKRCCCSLESLFLIGSALATDIAKQKYSYEIPYNNTVNAVATVVTGEKIVGDHEEIRQKYEAMVYSLSTVYESEGKKLLEKFVSQTPDPDASFECESYKIALKILAKKEEIEKWFEEKAGINPDEIKKIFKGLLDPIMVIKFEVEKQNKILETRAKLALYSLVQPLTKRFSKVDEKAESKSAAKGDEKQQAGKVDKDKGQRRQGSVSLKAEAKRSTFEYSDSDDIDSDLEDGKEHKEHISPVFSPKRKESGQESSAQVRPVSTEKEEHKEGDGDNGIAPSKEITSELGAPKQESSFFVRESYPEAQIYYLKVRVMQEKDKTKSAELMLASEKGMTAYQQLEILRKDFDSFKSSQETLTKKHKNKIKKLKARIKRSKESSRNVEISFDRFKTEIFEKFKIDIQAVHDNHKKKVEQVEKEQSEYNQKVGQVQTAQEDNNLKLGLQGSRVEFLEKVFEVTKSQIQEQREKASTLEKTIKKVSDTSSKQVASLERSIGQVKAECAELIPSLQSDVGQLKQQLLLLDKGSKDSHASLQTRVESLESQASRSQQSAAQVVVGDSKQSMSILNQQMPQSQQSPQAFTRQLQVQTPIKAVVEDRHFGVSGSGAGGGAGAAAGAVAGIGVRSSLVGSASKVGVYDSPIDVEGYKARMRSQSLPRSGESRPKPVHEGRTVSLESKEGVRAAQSSSSSGYSSYDALRYSRDSEASNSSSYTPEHRARLEESQKRHRREMEDSARKGAAGRAMLEHAYQNPDLFKSKPG
ncbi:MAG: hypothetical protein H0W88_01310 [Parachlamydiaceae bacterium]|nr:hypothetical protein [Parachlamydiaceae bacterium]